MMGDMDPFLTGFVTACVAIGFYLIFDAILRRWF
jgi:hypothetical protein